MKRKVVWLLVSCLMVAALLLGSCTPAVVEEKKVAPPVKEEKEKVAPPVVEKEKVASKEKEMVKLSLTKIDGTVVEKMVEKPRYGGVVTQAWYKDAPLAFDDIYGTVVDVPTGSLTREPLVAGDWSKGPAGTNENNWHWWTYVHSPYFQANILAESWEMPDSQTIVWHIRKGVHFHDKPPANGREMNADDVVFSFTRAWLSPRGDAKGYPWAIVFQELNGGPWIEATDKWTVVTKSLPGQLRPIYQKFGQTHRVVPREVIEKYKDMNDWRNDAGTGPFMLVDYIPASSATFKRNPNYWRHDPLHPENQLPYVDTAKWLFIPDISTKVAALRTAKVDQLNGITWEDAQSLMRSNPELGYGRFMKDTQKAIAPRLDKPGLPWAGYDKKALNVRRALSMAIDNQAIADTFYGGEAEILMWPAPVPELINVYKPLAEFSESIRELYEYHPDKARQLLAEAGYPNGFKAAIILKAEEVDLLSIVKDYWAKIGVNLELQVKDPGVFKAISGGFKHEEMITADFNVNNVSTLYFYSADRPTLSMVNDPYINELKPKIFDAYFDEPVLDELLKEFFPYVLEQNYYLWLPTPYVYNFWQPWVKNYHGETEVGYWNFSWETYIWIDQELKKAMGH